VDAALVVGGAQGGEVLLGVIAAGRAEHDVVGVEVSVRGAARDGAAPAVALHHPMLARLAAAAQPPGLFHVAEHGVKGLAGRAGAPLGALDAALHRGMGRAEEARHVLGRPEAEPVALVGAVGGVFGVPMRRTALQTRGHRRQRRRIQVPGRNRSIDVVAETAQRHLADAVLEGYRAEGDGGERSALDLLTPREREVLQLLAEGHPARDIAARLHVSVKTVGTHREHLMQKLGTQSLAGLTKFAIREGLTSVAE
jgi:DNA-binding CsgD family transcriptional regulator